MSFTKQLARDGCVDTARQWKALSRLLVFPVRLSVHFLTLIDKLDVLLVRGREALFLLVVCGASRSRVMVLLAVQTVENYLGRGEAEGWEKRRKENATCHNKQPDVLNSHFPAGSFSHCQTFGPENSSEAACVGVRDCNSWMKDHVPPRLPTRSHTHTAWLV